jgi:hypothetical protein
MNREHEHEDLIDLGAVSVETRGPSIGRDDQQGGLVFPAGLSHE